MYSSPKSTPKSKFFFKVKVSDRQRKIETSAIGQIMLIRASSVDFSGTCYYY